MAKEAGKKNEAAEAAQTDTALSNAGVKNTVAKAKKVKSTLPGPRMYVGPTISGIGIQNRVYTAIPADAEEKAGQMPEIRHLFIPVKEYPIANKMLREKKGYIYSAFCKVGAFKNGGKVS
ncbi:MAG: hypothetical protein HFH21_11445 [Ruminococcus sp.]|jgi:hypothetical protein|nr:hypothetical protein [uncultured Schaedlerella sp.]MCI8768377.1 hypothetical protein [Ruminococcus sp.]